MFMQYMCPNKDLWNVQITSKKVHSSLA